MKLSKGQLKLAREIINDIPTNWLDPLLTGPNAVISAGHQYDGKDIENVLLGLKNKLTEKYLPKEKAK